MVWQHEHRSWTSLATTLSSTTIPEKLLAAIMIVINEIHDPVINKLKNVRSDTESIGWQLFRLSKDGSMTYIRFHYAGWIHIRMPLFERAQGVLLVKDRWIAPMHLLPKKGGGVWNLFLSIRFMQMTSSWHLSWCRLILIIDNVYTRALFDNKEDTGVHSFTSCRFAALFNQLR
jgi:hypothetical protein